MTDPQRCPIHANPDEGSELEKWQCPDDCRYFLAELQRRIDDVKIHGNYTRMTVVDGVRMRQEFRNHQPVDEATPWRTR